MRISPPPRSERLDPAAGTATLTLGQRGQLEVTLQAFRGSRVAEQVANVRVRQERPSVRTFTSAVDSRSAGHVTVEWEVSNADRVQITPRIGAVGPKVPRSSTPQIPASASSTGSTPATLITIRSCRPSLSPLCRDLL